MINRTLVRTKVVQTLFAHYSGSDHTVMGARKTLLNKFNSTYSLYMLMLQFADELTTYAEEQISANKKRAAVLHQTYNANRNFVNNRVAQQVFNNRRIRNYMEDQHLHWDVGMSAVETIYKQLIDTDFYKEYMALAAPTYEDEKALWRKIYGQLLLSNEALISALEEMEVALDYEGWTIDIDMVLTYVVKTIKRMKEDDSDELPLLEMFASEEEFSFAKELMQKAMEQADENKALISKALQNWEADRVAYMDQVILLVALAEIREFHSIALEISMNEYIEIAKEYSSEKSYVFINGVLNKVVNDPDVKISVLESNEPSRISTTDCEGWQKLVSAVASTWRGCVVTPYLMVQCSDSRHWGRISDRVYRFSAMALTSEERATIHGNNERVTLEGISQAVEFYIRFIKRL